MYASAIDRPPDYFSPLRAPVVVVVSGDHDIATVDTLSFRLNVAAATGPGPLEIDLGGVTFMDASTVGVLCEIARTLQFDGRQLIVRSPSPPARRVLELCEMVGPLGFPFDIEVDDVDVVSM